MKFSSARLEVFEGLWIELFAFDKSEVYQRVQCKSVVAYNLGQIPYALYSPKYLTLAQHRLSTLVLIISATSVMRLRLACFLEDSSCGKSLPLSKEIFKTSKISARMKLNLPPAATVMGCQERVPGDSGSPTTRRIVIGLSNKAVPRVVRAISPGFHPQTQQRIRRIQRDRQQHQRPETKTQGSRRDERLRPAPSRK